MGARRAIARVFRELRRARFWGIALTVVMLLLWGRSHYRSDLIAVRAIAGITTNGGSGTRLIYHSRSGLIYLRLQKYADPNPQETSRSFAWILALHGTLGYHVAQDGHFTGVLAVREHGVAASSQHMPWWHALLRYAGFHWYGWNHHPTAQWMGEIIVPWWALVWFLVCVDLLLLRRPLRRWCRRRRGLCPHCGYDLRASGGRCPECGVGARDSSKPQMRQEPVRNGEP